MKKNIINKKWKYTLACGGIGFLIGLIPLSILFILGKYCFGNETLFCKITSFPYISSYYILNPILKLEGFGVLLYFYITPIFYLLIGLLIGHIVYKIKFIGQKKK